MSGAAVASLLVVHLLAGAARAAPAASTGPSGRTRIALMGMSAGAGVADKVAATAEEMLLTALFRTGRFDVVGRSDIANLIGFERQKQLAGCTEDVSCAAEIAGALGVTYLAAAGMGRIGTLTVLSLKIIDVSHARVVARSEARPAADSDLPAALEKLVAEAVAVCESEGCFGARSAAALPPPSTPPAIVPPPAAPAAEAQPAPALKERRTELSLQGGYHQGPGAGGQGTLHFAWRIRSFFVGPEVGYTRATGQAVEHDLAGFPDRTTALRPTALAAGLRGGWRWRPVPLVAVFVAAALGGAMLYEPNRSGAPMFAGYLRPSLGVEVPADSRVFCYLDFAGAFYTGAPTIELHNLNPYGGVVPVSKKVSLDGFEPSLGVALAF